MKTSLPDKLKEMEDAANCKSLNVVFASQVDEIAGCSSHWGSRGPHARLKNPSLGFKSGSEDQIIVIHRFIHRTVLSAQK
jgi:hypothetical protein